MKPNVHYTFCSSCGSVVRAGTGECPACKYRECVAHDFSTDKTVRVNVCEDCGLSQVEIELSKANKEIEVLRREIDELRRGGGKAE